MVNKQHHNLASYEGLKALPRSGLRTRLELPRLLSERPVRVRGQPCPLELRVQTLEKPRAQRNPKGDPLHPGFAPSPETFLSGKAGILGASLHARSVQRHDDRGSGGGGGRAARERRQSDQHELPGKPGEKPAQRGSLRIFPSARGLDKSESTSGDFTRRELSQRCRHGYELCQSG